MSLSLGLGLPPAPKKGVGGLRFTTSLPASVSYSRTGAATALTSGGVIVPFAANAPQITDRGLLLEPAATNLLLRSQEFDNASWVKARATITADATTSPDGTTNADAFNEDATAASGHDLTQAISKAASAIAYTSSVFAKKGGRDWICVTNWDGSSNGNRFWFNVNTGVIGSTATFGTPFTSTSYSILQAANGFWCCLTTFTTNTSTNLTTTFYSCAADGSTAPATGLNAVGLYMYGAQLLTGAGGSYIPTTNASAARGLPACTTTVPPGKTVARATYGTSNTVVDITGLTPGATFDLVTGRPWLGLGNELKTLEWRS